MSRDIKEKIKRIRDGGRPRVLDLFAGCGGISLGFQRAGFEIEAAIEFDREAAASHALNFHRHLPEPLREHHAQARDITKVEPAEYVAGLDRKGKPERVIDVIVGGPPCQAFARVGRAKLREVAEHPQAFKQDPRSNLYLRYLHYVRVLKPVALLMENVPDILNFGGHNIAEEVCESLEDLGYVCGYTLLNAVFYGVPEMRERMVLVAYHREVGQQVTFPAPSHWIDLPKGYGNSRQVALKTLKKNDLFAEGSHFVALPEASSDGLPRAVSAKQALADLPPITGHLTGELRRGTKNPREQAKYPCDPKPSAYANLMRNWPGFEVDGSFTGHVIRSLPRDYDIFRRMNPGDQYPEAYQHATALFEERLSELRRLGRSIPEGGKEYLSLKASIVPPYDAGKFPNKWRKMEPDAPARTLMAHLGKDGYSHIHYDSQQARTISVREAARLQSFPDGFLFAGSMNPAFRQIGNAVPPLMAYAVASEMAEALRSEGS
ncbi:MAG: DNA cytosine methyltransferase [Xanthomonadales bacterium]|nr:DNA cytosine methyltransferase [Xanthomonadales bacterium]